MKQNYEITCVTRKLSYFGQTNRHLKQRYQEYMRYIKHNDPQSSKFLHISNIMYE